MRRKEEKGGNYFWIKGPVDLFLFSASPLNLQLLHPASLSSFLSICIVLKALLVCTCSLLACLPLPFSGTQSFSALMSSLFTLISLLFISPSNSLQVLRVHRKPEKNPLLSLHRLQVSKIPNRRVN